MKLTSMSENTVKQYLKLVLKRLYTSKSPKVPFIHDTHNLEESATFFVIEYKDITIEDISVSNELITQFHRLKNYEAWQKRKWFLFHAFSL